MFPPAGRGQPGQVPGRQPGVQHFPFPFMSFQQPQQSQPSQQPQQFQPSQQPQQSQPSTQGQEQQAPHIGQSTAQQNPQANVALSQLMSQLMPAIAPLAQQLAQAASGSPQSSQVVMIICLRPVFPSAVSLPPMAFARMNSPEPPN